MKHQDVKKEIISLFGEDFYNVTTMNADGVSGILYIKQNIKISDYPTIKAGFASTRYSDLQEELSGALVLDSIESAVMRIDLLSESVTAMFSKEIAESLLDDHYSFLQKEFMKKVNEKNNSNFQLEQILISDKSKEEFSSKLKNRWLSAYDKNARASTKGTFAEFEERMKVNVIINTLRYF